MPSMTIKPAFDLGQTVFLHTDSEQCERLVVGIYVNISKEMTYWLRYSCEEPSEHFADEIIIKKRVF